MQLLEDIRDTALTGKTEVMFLYFDGASALKEETQSERELRRIGVKWRFICEEGNTLLHYPLEEFRWLPKKFFKRNMQLIYGNKVALGCEVDKRTNQTIQIAIVESASLADSNRNLFNFMWESCRKPAFTTATELYD